MKIALALSGLPRLYPIAAASWGRILGKYPADVYIHSWSQGDEIDRSVIHQLSWTFHPKSIQLELPITVDVQKFPDRHWPCIDVYRSISMWHSITRAHTAVMQSGVPYDVIIRGRLDWFVKNLELIQHDGIVIPYDPDKLSLRFTYQNQTVYGYNDHFSYGSAQAMSKYVNTFDLIHTLYANEGVDYCPENFLTASLIKQHVPVLLQKMEHKLIRG